MAFKDVKQNYSVYILICRWVADVAGKKENIDWDKFK